MRRLTDDDRDSREQLMEDRARNYAARVFRNNARKALTHAIKAIKYYDACDHCQDAHASRFDENIADALERFIRESEGSMTRHWVDEQNSIYS